MRQTKRASLAVRKAFTHLNSARTEKRRASERGLLACPLERRRILLVVDHRRTITGLIDDPLDWNCPLKEIFCRLPAEADHRGEAKHGLHVLAQPGLCDWVYTQSKYIYSQ